MNAPIAMTQCSVTEMIMTHFVSPAPRSAPEKTTCVASASV